MNRQEVLNSLFLTFNQSLEKLEKNNELEASDLAYCEEQNKETRSNK